MVLESTIVCVDNSEYSRNGDFAPTRYMAQIDFVNMLCSAKIGSNPESTVGLLSMSGRSARILVTSTRDLGLVFTCMHDVKFDGTTDIIAGIQKAQLALKHRQNMMQRQRIVVFVSSPVKASLDSVVALAKKLKKNSVAVDVVNIGGEGENEDILNAFIENVNNNDNSHILHIPTSVHNLADTFMSSDVYLDRDAQNAAPVATGAADGAAAGAANEFPFGVDPAQDPELAMVLRISMEEERLRQEALARAKNAEGAADGTGDAAGSKKEGDADYDDDDDLYTADKDKMEGVESGTAPAGGAQGGAEEDMDEETRRAIELSMTDFEAPKDNSKDKS